jgi:hypothetical protein
MFASLLLDYWCRPHRCACPLLKSHGRVACSKSWARVIVIVIPPPLGRSDPVEVFHVLPQRLLAPTAAAPRREGGEVGG